MNEMLVPTEGMVGPGGGNGLAPFGWSPAVEAAFEPFSAGGLGPARVVAEDRGSYVVATASGEARAQVGGRFRYDAGDDPAAFPAVGDWVALDGGGNSVIQGVVPRRTAIVRLAPGRRTVAQVVGANVDVVFVVASLNHDLNLRRLERYLAVAWESGAEPVIVLSKADLADDPAEQITAVDRVAVGVRIITASAVDGRGMGALKALIEPGATVAFIGSSGVGKSHVDAAQRPRGRRAGGGQRDPRGRREGPPHDDAPAAPSAAGGRAGARHARDARARAMGCRRRSRAVVRRHRGPRGDVPVQRLRP